MEDLKGKKIIVCGGSGKMGRNMCDHFKKLGAFPIIIDRFVDNHETNLAFECDLSEFKNAKLTFDKLGAANNKKIAAIVPPANELYAAIASAFPALPCCAIGYPSKDVATVPGIPGAFIKIEDVDPPKTAP